MPRDKIINHFPPPKPDNSHEWVIVAKRVLAGEFWNADGSTAKALIIGMRNIDHPDCIRAVEMLEALK